MRVLIESKVLRLRYNPVQCWNSGTPYAQSAGWDVVATKPEEVLYPALLLLYMNAADDFCEMKVFFIAGE